jgi:hypothetical protein
MQTPNEEFPMRHILDLVQEKIYILRLFIWIELVVALDKGIEMGKLQRKEAVVLKVDIYQVLSADASFQGIDQGVHEVCFATATNAYEGDDHRALEIDIDLPLKHG